MCWIVLSVELIFLDPMNLVSAKRRREEAYYLIRMLIIQKRILTG